MIGSELESIKSSYEALEMTPEEIAVDRQLDIGAVKAALMQCSARYRRACGHENEEENKLNFTDADLEAANEVIRNLAVYGEDPYLQFKAATYIRDDKKGRKDVVKQIAGQQFNILMFNEQMAKVRDFATKAKERIIGNGHRKVINA